MYFAQKIEIQIERIAKNSPNLLEFCCERVILMLPITGNVSGNVTENVSIRHNIARKGVIP